MNELNFHSTNESNEQFTTELAQEIKCYLERELEGILELEKDEYKNDLVPFSQHKEQMRARGKEYIKALCSKLEKGEKLLKEHMELEERQSPNYEPDECFQRWEEASKLLHEHMANLEQKNEAIEEKTLQEKCGISSRFMDRAYAIAQKLQEDERFEEAHQVYTFLLEVNPLVFEYLFENANCLFELGKFEDAIEFYGLSMVLQPINPHIFFQISNCLFQLGEIEDSLKVLDICITYASEDASYQELLDTANKAKEFLKARNSGI